MLLYPSGLEFIEAFLGCLAAGVIAVPAYPPRKNRSVERLLAIADDCSPCLILTTREVAPTLIPEIVNGYVFRKCLCTEMETSRDKGNFAERSGSTTGLNRWLDHLRPEQSAFLQYTSGSTRRPRGVVVTHRNLMHNERVIQASVGSSAGTVAVSWLPLFHDMGLIGGVLHPLYLGCEAILLSPTAFLAEPVSWLCHHGVSRYDYRWAELRLGTLFLRQGERGREIRIGFKQFGGCIRRRGAGPRLDTGRLCGCLFQLRFQRSSFCPCYGLAESTLFVSGGSLRRELPRIQVSSSAL